MCEYCNAIYYVEVKQLMTPMLAPLTHTEEIRQELINKTGINHLRIKANYCPMCGRELKQLLDSLTIVEIESFEKKYKREKNYGMYDNRSKIKTITYNK